MKREHGNEARLGLPNKYTCMYEGRYLICHGLTLEVHFCLVIVMEMYLLNVCETIHTRTPALIPPLPPPHTHTHTQVVTRDQGADGKVSNKMRASYDEQLVE